MTRKGFIKAWDDREMRELTEVLSPIFSGHGHGLVDQMPVAVAARQEAARVEGILIRDRQEESLIPPEAERQLSLTDRTILHIESYTRAQVKISRTEGAMAALYANGSITQDQFTAAQEIAQAAELFGRGSGVRSASLEARVDNSGSAKDLLVEHIAAVHREVSYTRWRKRLPKPERLVIGMIVDGCSIIKTARRYRFRVAVVRNRLHNALDEWQRIRQAVSQEIDERDVSAAQFRAGGGVLK